jgi:hypothetical protein
MSPEDKTDFEVHPIGTRRAMENAARAIEHLRAEKRQLREFVAALFEASDWPRGGDIELATFEGLCVAHGVLLEEKRTEPCSPECHCAEIHGAEGMADGVTCYRKPQWLLDTIAQMCNDCSVDR